MYDSEPNWLHRLPGIIARINRPDFFFVNIGANDGVSNDPIYPFLRRYGWRGIAVEPLPYICEELRRNYASFPDVIIEHAAIAATPRPLHYVDPAATDVYFIRQISSLDVAYVEKTIDAMRTWQFQGPVPEGIEHAIRRAEVPCLTFDELLAKHRVTHIDFLNIDAEQCDFEIFSMVDWRRWRPSVLCLETSEFTVAQELHVRQVLALAGYVYLERFEIFSDIYVQYDALG